MVSVPVCQSVPVFPHHSDVLFFLFLIPAVSQNVLRSVPDVPICPLLHEPVFRFLLPVSLYEPVYSDGGDTIYVMDQVSDHHDDTDWLGEISMKEAIKNLGEREKRILSLRFLSGKTQVEVAREIGISQAQVSRLEKGALDQIKKQL